MNNLKLLGSECDIEICSEKFRINGEKALFWSKHEILIVSDLHFGKAGHFRKNGIPIPSNVHLNDLLRLEKLVNHYLPKTIIFLGDLFHSEINNEWNVFAKWSTNHKKIRQVLVRGNHDIIDIENYSLTFLEITDEFELLPFLFTHETKETSLYNISGHIHPSVRLLGLLKNQLNLPCFVFGKRSGLVPSFGQFTGNHRIRPKRSELVLAVSDKMLFSLMF